MSKKQHLSGSDSMFRLCIDELRALAGPSMASIIIHRNAGDFERGHSR